MRAALKLFEVWHPSDVVLRISENGRLREAGVTMKDLRLGYFHTFVCWPFILVGGIIVLLVGIGHPGRAGGIFIAGILLCCCAVAIRLWSPRLIYDRSTFTFDEYGAVRIDGNEKAWGAEDIDSFEVAQIMTIGGAPWKLEVGGSEGFGKQFAVFDVIVNLADGRRIYLARHMTEYNAKLTVRLVTNAWNAALGQEPLVRVDRPKALPRQRKVKLASFDRDQSK